ncbi:MAG: SIS domain-containing protein [Kurthia sp.]|nr:SIS domain-containing protein [Candidatus Kurthia equi]
MTSYLNETVKLLQRIEQQERQGLQNAAQLMYKSIAAGGIIQLYGSGHSQLLAQESFYRAGGLVPAKPISIEELMLHKGALSSSSNEKDLSKIEAYWSQIDLHANDVLVVVSTSGRNAIPVEIALRAKELGIPVISLQSLEYRQQVSRHPSGKRLEDIADVVLNTGIPVGDGLLMSEGLQYGPASTIAGAAMLNEAIVQAIDLLKADGKELPVFGSSNVEQAQNNNEYYIEKYKNRITFD